MPRKPREIRQDEYYHILSRGNNRQKLFYEPKDYAVFLRLLKRYINRHSVLLYHYCLMTNHVHLLMRSDKSHLGITKTMHGLQTAYASYFKKCRQATGHVFENRFRDFHIDSEAYLLECGRYIERNPVRAKMVAHPEFYPWSSYRHYAGGIKNPLLSPNPMYEALGRSLQDRRRVYRDYVKTIRAYEVLVDRYLDERVLI